MIDHAGLHGMKTVVPWRCLMRVRMIAALAGLFSSDAFDGDNLAAGEHRNERDTAVDCTVRRFSKGVALDQGNRTRATITFTATEFCAGKTVTTEKIQQRCRGQNGVYLHLPAIVRQLKLGLTGGWVKRGVSIMMHALVPVLQYIYVFNI